MKHNDSKEHKTAVDAHHMRQQLYGDDSSSAPIFECDDKVQIEVKESEVHLFHSVYYCAKENLPNLMVNSQLRFLKASGIDPSVSDIHSDTVQDVQNSLLYVLDNELKSRLKGSKYYGVIVDESTDLSIHKKLVVYIRYVCGGEMKTELVGNIRIPDGSAKTIAEEIRIKLQCLGLDVANLVGLGSDGASVMFGRKGGVGVILSDDAPLLTHVHCVAHRLSLVCSDAAKDFPYLKTYKDILKNLYFHVSGSGIRTYKLEAMQEIMNEPQLRLKDPINIRWLAMENAVKTIHKCYGSVVAYLESNEGKNTIGDNIAEGLLKDVLHYKFPAFTAALTDVLSIVGVLCKQLQSENLDLSQYLPMLESATGRLRALKTVNGESMDNFQKELTMNGNKTYYKGIQLKNVNEKSSVEKLKVSYIDSVIDNLEARMSTDKTPMLNAFSVFEPVTNESLSAKDIEGKLTMLSDRYELDCQKLRLEHAGLQPLLKGSYKSLSFQTFCGMVLRRHSEDFPLIATLCKIALCIPVTSVACERGFSLQNRIKVKSRTALTPENLDMLMKLSTGPDIEDFPYPAAIQHWRKEKKRRLARLYQSSKKV